MIAIASRIGGDIMDSRANRYRLFDVLESRVIGYLETVAASGTQPTPTAKRWSR